MKQIFFAIMIIALAAPSLSAQKERGSSEKMKALKVAVFTEELSLSAKEAEKFWPLYNEYEQKIRTLSKKEREQYKNSVEGKSDKEIEKMIEMRFKLKEQKLKLEREYYKKFKKVLPVAKVAQIPNAHRKFKLTIMRKTKEYKKGRKPHENF